MSQSQLQFGSPSTIAKWTMMLVLWVVLACLSQNTGLSVTCPKGQVQNTQDESVDLTPSCDLSEKLVQAHQNQLEHIHMPFYLYTIVAAQTVIALAIHYLAYTEPISNKYRIHLKLCVFRE